MWPVMIMMAEPNRTFSEPKTTVGEPCTEDRRQIHATTVRADEAGRQGLVDPEAAFSGREVHVVEKNALHAVEGEALPHLYGEEAGQHLWVAEKGRIARRCSGGIG
jgi:hypothetical protein